MSTSSKKCCTSPETCVQFVLVTVRDFVTCRVFVSPSSWYVSFSV